jgi:ribonuclease BN (tRNA processing enzyme)/polynucleotide 5'-kinase involved in rRNA processing
MRKPGDNDQQHTCPVLDTAYIIDTVMAHDRRVMLFGPAGIGKSTLAVDLARTLSASERPCQCINADPGSPAFGVPGAVSTAVWRDDGWKVTDLEALCTLDAGRFRLPLVSRVRALAQRLPPGTVLLDAPGVTRGIAGRELLHGLVEASAVDAILVLTAPDRLPPLFDELNALPVELYVINAAVEAKRPGKRVRARQRTAQWDACLAHAMEQRLDLARYHITGTPPLPAETTAWHGKQIALLTSGRTTVMGEVLHVESQSLYVRLAGNDATADTLLIRDAMRSADGYIETARPYATEPVHYLPPNDVLPSIDMNNGPRIAGRVGAVDFALVNGVFGDPLLHLRLRHQRRSLLFDLGSGERLPARIAHQVSDVFISHAHMDHIGGFLWLLRSRIGDYPSCRLHGPPGLARHIEGFLQGILWDRIEDNAPKFDVMELHDDRVKRYRLQAGTNKPVYQGEATAVDGVLLTEKGFRVRAITLDHGGTPVLAFALEAEKQLNIRKDRLMALGFEPGPWLNTLKQCLLEDDTAALIETPDGSCMTAQALADELVLIVPGKKLAYATDLADTDENRRQLTCLARHAHTLLCECAFSESDTRLAAMNGHLTTHACGEIATEAGVSRLLPFHFSRRYMSNLEQMYEEVSRYCSRVFRPDSMALLDVAEE